MFKPLITLLRGRTFEAAQAVTDANIVTVLDQQLRDSAVVLDRARKAVAIATAEKSREAADLDRTRRRIADLEDRARMALDSGQEALAMEAAEAIATLEAERDASQRCLETYGAEIARLSVIVRDADARFLELKRGQRLAIATDRAQKLRDRGFGHGTIGLATLKEAEETLKRLRDRQAEIDVATEALEEMDLSANPSPLVDRLARAGCGAPTRPNAQSVLDRLRKPHPA
jgi:phage shock protein A